MLNFVNAYVIVRPNVCTQAFLVQTTHPSYPRFPAKAFARDYVITVVLRDLMLQTRSCIVVGPSSRSSVMWRDPILRLGDPDFLFDLVYIMGYISYRYGSTGENYNISPL